MKFKHTFNVFADNFSITYKHLLYRLIVLAVAGAICFAGIYPFIQRELLNSAEFTALTEGIKNFVMELLNGNVEVLADISDKIQAAFDGFITLLHANMLQLVLSGLLLLAVFIVEKWFTGMGNYATAAIINDKMAMRQQSPFVATLIKNLKPAALYNLIYVPLSALYDVIVGVGMFYLMFVMVNSFLPFYIGIFLFVLIIVLAIALKMTFTADWLPALIRGKMGQKEAMIYSFSRTNKKTVDIYSNFVVLVLIIFGGNVAAGICTLGVGLLITVPASYIVLLSFEFANYYDREEIKYFVDKNKIIRPEKEHPVTREEFFRGEE